MKCPKCEGTTSCLAGESAHPRNWYCDDETCGWDAWATPQQKIITTEAVDEITKLKKTLRRARDCLFQTHHQGYDSTQYAEAVIAEIEEALSK